jgi:pilus assembly protein CpaF
MLQAMNTGHEGSLTTVHANTPRDALSRLETMILLAGGNLTQQGMRQQIASAIALVIQIQRFSDGVRRMVSCSEIVGMEGHVVSMQDLYVFQQTGVAPDGTVQGEFAFTGLRPACAERLERMGLQMGLDGFAASVKDGPQGFSPGRQLGG